MPNGQLETVVEIWESTVVRSEGVPFGSFKTELAEISPPVKQREIELPLGMTVDIGRTPKSTMKSRNRINITGIDEVSRVALTLTEGSAGTTVEVGQLGGVFMQYWGHQGSWSREQYSSFEVRSVPVSFRIETIDRYFWVLINPCARFIPDEYASFAMDNDVTDGQRLTIPNDAPAIAKFEAHKNSVKEYFHQFLEWPPRISPVAGVPKGQSDKRKQFLAVASALTEVGFPRYSEYSRDVELIQRLVQHGLVSLNADRRGRTESVTPKTSQ